MDERTGRVLRHNLWQAFFLTVGLMRCVKGAEGVVIFSLFCGRLRWVYGHYSSDSCSQTDGRLFPYQFVSGGLVSRISGPLQPPNQRDWESVWAQHASAAFTMLGAVVFGLSHPGRPLGVHCATQGA